MSLTLQVTLEDEPSVIHSWIGRCSCQDQIGNEIIGYDYIITVNVTEPVHSAPKLTWIGKFSPKEADRETLSAKILDEFSKKMSK